MRGREESKLNLDPEEKFNRKYIIMYKHSCHTIGMCKKYH